MNEVEIRGGKGRGRYVLKQDRIVRTQLQKCVVIDLVEGKLAVVADRTVIDRYRVVTGGIAGMEAGDGVVTEVGLEDEISAAGVRYCEVVDDTRG